MSRPWYLRWKSQAAINGLLHTALRAGDAPVALRALRWGADPLAPGTARYTERERWEAPELNLKEFADTPTTPLVRVLFGSPKGHLPAEHYGSEHDHPMLRCNPFDARPQHVAPLVEDLKKRGASWTSLVGPHGAGPWHAWVLWRERLVDGAPSPAHQAMREAFAEAWAHELLQQGLAIDAVDTYGETALGWALMRQCAAPAQQLVTWGASRAGAHQDPLYAASRWTYHASHHCTLASELFAPEIEQRAFLPADPAQLHWCLEQVSTDQLHCSRHALPLRLVECINDALPLLEVLEERGFQWFEVPQDPLQLPQFCPYEGMWWDHIASAIRQRHGTFAGQWRFQGSAAIWGFREQLQLKHAIDAVLPTALPSTPRRRM